MSCFHAEDRGQNTNQLNSFAYSCNLQKQLTAQGIQFISDADESITEPESFMAVDPDGNSVLVDQHV